MAMSYNNCINVTELNTYFLKHFLYTFTLLGNKFKKDTLSA